MATDDTIQLVHPLGKNAPKISLKTFELFSTAIIQVLEQHEQLTLTAISEGVRKYIADNSLHFEGSIEWYTVSVKQHLEFEGVIETKVEKGRKMHRLVKA